MTKIDVVALDVYVQKFTDVLLLLVAVQLLAFEFLPDVGQFLVDALLFKLSSPRIPEVSNELYEASHGRHGSFGCDGSTAATDYLAL